MESDVLKTLSGGLGLAGKLMGRGVDEVSRAIRRSDDHPEIFHTGLFACPWEGEDWSARLRYHEPCDQGRLGVTLFKNLTMSGGEKDFIAGLGAVLTGQTQEACTRLREATRRTDSKAQLTDAYFLLGALQVCAGELSEAARLLKTALLAQQSLGKNLRKYAPSLHIALPLTRFSSFCIYPDLLGLNLLLALAYRNEQPQEAVHILEQYLEIVPNELTALFFVNLFRMQTRAYRDIFASLSRTLPDSNLQVAQMILLGKACHKLGDPTTAREIFRKALQRADLDRVLKMDLRTALGQALQAEGYPRDAEQEFSAVAREDAHYRALEVRFGLVSPPEAAPVEAPPAPESAPEPTPSPPTRELTPAPAPTGPIVRESGGITCLVQADGELRVELGQESVVIGRDEGDVVLGDASASRRHAQIVYDSGLFWIEDLQSTNGTWVNRHRIRRRVELHRGDVIQIGETRFEVG